MSDVHVIKTTKRCPYCLGGNVEGKGVVVLEKTAEQACVCLDCEETWLLEFVFVGVVLE